ncbi:DgyrCDS3687 [Dimorphilus gyrociliatus]|uniref:DgyrCDS3687 n=1 Tax=Dimorphilus gyrociliatus TaxID=2664684 RepID=A0A7I8VF67_9ANNE|nr:DgyrCDS3687 [Dimorphilus gyrociliatus]
MESFDEIIGFVFFLSVIVLSVTSGPISHILLSREDFSNILKYQYNIDNSSSKRVDINESIAKTLQSKDVCVITPYQGGSIYICALSLYYARIRDYSIDGWKLCTGKNLGIKKYMDYLPYIAGISPIFYAYNLYFMIKTVKQNKTDLVCSSGTSPHQLSTNNETSPSTEDIDDNQTNQGVSSTICYQNQSIPPPEYSNIEFNRMDESYEYPPPYDSIPPSYESCVFSLKKENTSNDNSNKPV